jgi:hypothetical protein
MRVRARTATVLWPVLLALVVAGLAWAEPKAAPSPSEGDAPRADAPALAVAGGPVAPFLEVCDGYDDDIDGLVDEDCPCAPGDLQLCFPGPPGGDTGSCEPGVQRCVVERGDTVGSWGPCDGPVLPTDDPCGDGIDSDCDGFDLACPAEGGPLVKAITSPDPAA